MLLQDFNYFFNKAINQYINKRYNIYDINQQTTDDLRVLKATAVLTPTEKDESDQVYSELKNLGTGKSKLLGGIYEVILPDDYLHMLNCICIYKINSTYSCYDNGDYVQFPAKRLTADSWSKVIGDFYQRPLPTRPYYYIHNVNTSNLVPTNPIQVETIGNQDYLKSGTDYSTDYDTSKIYITAYKAIDAEIIGPPQEGVDKDEDGYILTHVGENGFWDDKYLTSSNNFPLNKFEIKTITRPEYPRVVNLQAVSNNSLIQKEAGQRYGNSSKVRCEIRYGHDNSIFTLEKVLIDYIKSPQVIRLTQQQVNLTKDTSQIMEFPDYVCQEIINELVHLVMENTADPRLQTHIPVSQSIANPAQQQTPQPQQRGS